MRPVPFKTLAVLAAFAAGFDASVATPARAVTAQTAEEAARHWAYQPVTRREVPEVRARSLVRSPIDAFLLARLEPAGGTLAPRADARTLLRRMYFDLIGLPPTYEEIEAFRRNDSPEALAVVVDRLLADPRYGERWGRHWLDVARYADTKDLVLLYGRDALRPFAYTYRDYVIRSFNEDLPFNEFVQDQLAADLVQPALPPWRLAGLGFLTLGRLFDNNTHDQIDDQIDTVSRGLLGLTVACARCHDHKYDAVKMEDYYGLYGVFASTERPNILPLIEDPAGVPGGEAFEAQLGRACYELESHIEGQRDFLADVLRRRLGDYFVRAVTTKPDITETTQFALSLTPEDFRPSLMLRTRRFLEQRVVPGDRVFGLWAELLALPDADWPTRAAAVAGRVVAAGGEANNPHVVAHLAGTALATRAEVPRAWGELLQSIYRTHRETACGEGAYLVGPDIRELLEIVEGETGPLWFAWRDTPDHMSRPAKDRYGALALNLDKIAARASNAPPARAMVLADLPRPYDSKVFLRGNPARPGRSAPRGFLGVLHGGERPLFAGEGSGRLELARAVTSPGNPLTARVFVNRVWMHHFGEPLAASTTDFGARSEAPTNPELLDWLADEFMRSGWSVKSLHRQILLSAAFQQSSSRDPVVGSPGAVAADPENRLLGHFPRRRLDLEAMRDTLLAVSGRLDARMGGRPVDVAGDALNSRRTVYGLVDRQNLPGLFRSFDFATPDQCAERRPRTSVPQQALYAMNAPFVLEQARALAALTAREAGTETGAVRVQALFRRTLGRVPTAEESDRALRFVGAAANDDPTEVRVEPWEQLAQVLLVSNEAVFVD